LWSGFIAAFAQNSVPVVYEPLLPAAVLPGSLGFTLTVHGTGFVPGATVNWNGTSRTTTFTSSSQLTADVPAADVITAGTASITVVNPGTNVASNVVFFPVVTPSLSVFYAHAPGSPIDTGQQGGLLTEPLSLATGDFNGDGKMDLVVGVEESGIPGRVETLLGNGDGTFTLLSSMATAGRCPCGMAVGDLNADGKLDLVVENYDDNTVSIFLGDGAGDFVPAAGSPIPVGTGPFDVKLADFDHDGKLDLVVANSTANTITTLLGNGDGTFVFGSSSPATLTPDAIAVADLNRDGNLDLAVSNFDANVVTILLGNGDGSFAPAISIPARAGLGIVAADFNHDGNLDLAATNRSDGTVSILLGNGDGSFSLVAGCCGIPVDFNRAQGIVAGDFNGDGTPDLALTILSSPGFLADYIEILLGNGDGTFSLTDYSLQLPDEIVSAAAGDFNNDGKLDFATASSPFHSVSVLLQTPPGASPDFSVIATTSSITVPAGGTGKFPIEVASLNGFLGEISFTCTGAPKHATCSLPDSAFLFDKVTALFDASVVTTANSQAVRRSAAGSPRTLTLPLWSPILAGIFFCALQRKSIRVARSGFLVVLLMAILLVASCGTDSTPPPPPPPPGGTPPGTYTLTLRATSGTIQRSTTVTLIVQ